MTQNMDIVVRLRDRASKGIAAVGVGIGKIGGIATAVGRTLTSFQAKLAGIGIALGGAAFLRSTVRTFVEFDDTMRAVGAVTGATAEEMKSLTNAAKEMGRTTRYTASNAAEGLKFLGMAGFTATEAVSALPGVLQLAAAGGLELGQAADIATNVLDGFGLKVEQLGTVNDVLVKTFTSTNSTLGELGEAFKMVGPIASGVGGDFEDLVASLGMLHSAGIKGTMAGTALRSAIDALMNPTREETKLMDKLAQRMGGVSLQTKDAEGNFIGFVAIIEQLEAAGLRGEEALELFGLRAGPSMAALVSKGSEALKELANETRNAGGVSKQVADDMEAGLGGAIRAMKSAFEGIKIEIGEAFGDDLKEIVENVRDWFLDLIKTIIRLKEDGTLQEWKDRIVIVFDAVWWAIKKVKDALDAVAKLIVVVALAATGEWKMARLALNEYGEAVEKLVGINQKVYHKIKMPEKPSGLQEGHDMSREEADWGERKAPIGRVERKKTETFAPKVSEDAEMEAAAIRLKADVAMQLAEIEIMYDQGKKALDEYYSERAELVRKNLETEINLMQRAADRETDLDARAKMDAQIYAKKKELEQSLLELTAERIEKEQELEKKRVKEQEDLNKSREAIERTFVDIKQRIAAGESGFMEARFQQEIFKLQERHNAELELLQKNKATEAEILDLQRQQEYEKMQVHEDQARRLLEYRLDSVKQIAGGMADAFGEMYEMTGKKHKEFFYAQKALALAEATINIAQGITKAWGQGGIMGGIGAAVVAASGAVQIAKIMGMGVAMAEGGEVPGHSPTSKSDNISARLTAGEYVHPVKAVKYYGKGVMEAIRNMRIPKESLGSFIGFPNISQPRFQYAFAEGGSVGPAPAGQNMQQEQKMDIVNIVDKAVFDHYLSSNAGKKVLMNVIRSNAYELKNAMASEM